MQLACSSTAFDEQLRGDRLTQLEWIDLCAHEIGADGIVLDMRHFPRTDTDYLAQIKKMAVDLGLAVTALRHDGFFEADQPHMEQAAEMALALGAPVLSAPLPSETTSSWTQVLERLGNATSIAKRLNVTVAVRNAPHSFAASSHDMKRVTKEADSAWLRYGPNVATLEAGSDAQALLAKTVLLWIDARADEQAAVTSLLQTYRGFIALDDAQGASTVEFIKASIHKLRTAAQ